MGQVSATSSIAIAAPPEKILALIVDYQGARPRIHSDHYRDYRVVSGGHGAGIVVEWTLQATKKRARNVRASVAIADNTVTEADANSSLVTTWVIDPVGTGAEVVTTTEWNGAGGVGGFFERTFAPLGLRKIQAEVLAKLKAEAEK